MSDSLTSSETPDSERQSPSRVRYSSWTCSTSCLIRAASSKSARAAAASRRVFKLRISSGSDSAWMTWREAASSIRSIALSGSWRSVR